MKKISELTEATAVQDADYLVVNTSGGTQKTKVNTVRLPVVNGFTTTTSGSVLDARAGKTLKDEVNTLSSQQSTMQTGMAAKLDSGMFEIVEIAAPNGSGSVIGNNSSVTSGQQFNISYSTTYSKDGATYTCLGMVGFNTGNHSVNLVTSLYNKGATTLQCAYKATAAGTLKNPSVKLLFVKTTV